MLKVKVVPGSAQNQLDGWLGDFLKIHVSAKPEKGKANEAMVALLAKTLRISKKDIIISSGASSPRKMIKIKELTNNKLISRLPARDA